MVPSITVISPTPFAITQPFMITLPPLCFSVGSMNSLWSSWTGSHNSAGPHLDRTHLTWSYLAKECTPDIHVPKKVLCYSYVCMRKIRVKNLYVSLLFVYLFYRSNVLCTCLSGHRNLVFQILKSKALVTNLIGFFLQVEPSHLCSLRGPIYRTLFVPYYFIVLQPSFINQNRLQMDNGHIEESFKYSVKYHLS